MPMRGRERSVSAILAADVPSMDRVEHGRDADQAEQRYRHGRDREPREPSAPPAQGEPQVQVDRVDEPHDATLVLFHEHTAVDSASTTAQTKKTGAVKAWWRPIARTSGSKAPYFAAQSMTTGAEAPPCGTAVATIDHALTHASNQTARVADPRNLMVPRQALMIT